MTQLELDLGRAGSVPPVRVAPRVRLRSALHAALHWTPVWVPLVFLGQLLVLGLRPALAERARLDQAEAEVRARAAALRAEELELAEQAHMLGDAVYQERVRRSLLDPAVRPLTLERARATGRP